MSVAESSRVGAMLRGWRRRLAKALRLYGLFGAVLHLVALVRHRAEVLAGRRQDVRQLGEDRRFDEHLGVDTGGTISLSDLDIQRPSWIYGLCYVASQAELVDELLRKLPIRHEEFVFVDLGSGKGRVLLIASHFPFQKVVGVELSGELHGIAVQNIGRQRDDARRCLDVTSTCGDAADYEFPDAPTVLYLYRPFLESVLATVLVRLRASVQDRPRPVYLVYNNPEPGSVLERTDFLRLVDEDPEKAWAIYSVR